MQILSHRGYWKGPAEKNSAVAFRRSFELGFGTETDIRDACGTLVISHDPPASVDAQLSAEQFFELFCEYDRSLPLALNIKSDGLAAMLLELLRRFEIRNYFVFDMSVPDALGYLRHGVRAFTRQSELELQPSFYDKAAGVWMDAFYGDWIDHQAVQSHLSAGKDVCIVSPDLHKRPHEAVWRQYAGMESARAPGVMLCTDFPEEARRAFA